MTTMTISDAIATLSRRSRRQVSCHWLRPSTRLLRHGLRGDPRPSNSILG